MAAKKIVLLPGDGIGPEIVDEAVKVLRAVADVSGTSFTFDTRLIGGAAIDATGKPLPDDTLAACRDCDAVLLGAVGGPKWDELPAAQRPEKGLLETRKALDLYANVRPVKVHPALAHVSPVKPEIVEGVDLVIVRELTGGLYFGKPAGIEGAKGARRGFNTMVYTEAEIERIAVVAFDLARRRRRKLCSVDKANVLDVSRLWRDVVIGIGKRYPDVELSHMYVDNAAMQLIRWPKQFDVVLTENSFGDILSDEASILAGSLGMLASASLGGKVGLFESAHGSAPSFAGLHVCNPIAEIASAGMMLRHGLGMPEGADLVDDAIDAALAAGCRTQDIAPRGIDPISTIQMGDAIAHCVKKEFTAQEDAQYFADVFSNVYKAHLSD